MDSEVLHDIAVEGVSPPELDPELFPDDITIGVTTTVAIKPLPVADVPPLEMFPINGVDPVKVTTVCAELEIPTFARPVSIVVFKLSYPALDTTNAPIPVVVK